MNPRPCDTEASGRGTASMRIGHVDYPGKSDRTVPSHGKLTGAHAQTPTDTRGGAFFSMGISAHGAVGMLHDQFRC